MTCKAILRPSEYMFGQLGVMYGERGKPASGSILGVLDDLVKVDGLSQTLTVAIAENTSDDGRVDFTEVGAAVMKSMLSTMTLVGESGAAAADMKAADVLGRLIYEAIEKTQAGNGLTDMRKVAVYILRVVKEARI